MEKIYTKLKMLLLTGTFLMLTVMAFAQDLTIASGEVYTIDPTDAETYTSFTNNGTLIIKSDASGTGSLIVPAPLGNGIFNVERYLPSSNWHIVTVPVVGQTLGAFYYKASNDIAHKDDNYGIARYYAPTNSWVYATSADDATPAPMGYGFSVKRNSAGTVTCTGTSIYTGNIDVTTENSVSKWNSIGNIYTSAIWVRNAPDPAKDFLTENAGNLEAGYTGLYVWDPLLATGADYTVIALGTYTFPDPDGQTFGLLEQDKIAAGQGFIIKAAATEVNFTALMQVHASDKSGGDAEFKSAEKSTPAVRLTVTSGDLKNRAIVAFGKESTLGLDPGYDVGKLKGNPNMALYTKLVDGSSDVDFINQSVPDANYELLTIPVGLDLANAGEITFSLETSVGFPSNMKVYLEDKVLNTTTQLDKKGTIYSASVSSMKGYGRFNLHFSNSTTGIDLKKQNQTNFSVFTRDRLIFVNGPTDKNTHLFVYGIDGKMWYQNRAEATNRNTIDASGFAAGVYLVKIDKQSGSQTHKIVITE